MSMCKFRLCEYLQNCTFVQDDIFNLRNLVLKKKKNERS